MPLKKCSEGGKGGWKWGDSGKCYTGPGGKKKAIKQGIAVEGPDKFASEAKEFDEPVTVDELAEAMAECNYDVVSVAFAVAKLEGVK